MAGERAGDTMDGVVSMLRREQILVTRITPAQSKAAPKKTREKAAPAKNLAVFTRQFSVMIDAGLPLVQCLEILGAQEEDKNFSAVILQTRADVEGGASLADAMKKHPKTFDALYSNMIAAGEAGGILDTILKRLATYIEKAVKLKSQVKSAMIYPAAVIVIAVGVVGASDAAGESLFGIGVAVMAQLSMTGLIVALDAYGPVTDNAGGIAEMADLPEEVRGVTD
ncbi:MAG: sodium/proton-translocating pyrophosphatase, partial [Planctomycetaceae bacterium]